MIVDELQRCRHWIEAALEYSGGTHEFIDVVDGVLSGKMQLWPGERGCIVTEIVVYPRKKVLHIFLAGGELEQLLDMYDSVSQFGKSNGCARMTLAGRPGWRRVLSDWDHDFTVMGIDL